MYHIPIDEIHSDKAEAEKLISDLESRAAMDKKEIHLEVNHLVLRSSEAGIGDIFLCRRWWLYVNIWIQVEEVAVYFVTFFKSIEGLLDAFQLLFGDRGWLPRLNNRRANRSRMLRVAEIQNLMGNIDSRTRVFLLGSCCIVVSPSVVVISVIENSRIKSLEQIV